MSDIYSQEHTDTTVKTVKVIIIITPTNPTDDGLIYYGSDVQTQLQAEKRIETILTIIIATRSSRSTLLHL